MLTSCPLKVRYTYHRYVLHLLKVVIAIASCLPVSTVAAADSKISSKQVALEEVVITAVPINTTIDISRNVSTIDRSDIENSAATSITDLLASQANINLVSFSGNTKRTRIDFRGSGDTSVSNILIILDGRPLPNNQLASIDFSTLPVGNIEKIEVLRGANSVRYGSGASQGVIKITSNKNKKNSIKLASEQGSFDLEKYALDATLHTARQRLNLYFSESNTNGFRDHNELNYELSNIRYQYHTGSNTSIDLTHTEYRDSYELPGPISFSELIAGNISPQNSASANLNSGDVSQSRSALFFQTRLSNSISFSSHLLHDDRKDDIAIEVNSVFGQLQTKGDEFRSTVLWTASPYFTFESGVNFNKIIYTREDLHNQNSPFTIRDVDYRSRAAFVYSQIQLNKLTQLAIGYRRERTKNSNLLIPVDLPIPQQTTRQEWNNEAFEFGTNYSQGFHSTYLSASKSFRNPNGDEIQQIAANDLLVPQNGERYEAGYRLSLDKFDLRLSAFKFLVKDEIFFNQSGFGSGINENRELRTRRQGIETGIEIRPSRSLGLKANYDQLSATLIDGNTIPLVPERRVSAQISIEPIQRLVFSIEYRYIGSRFNGTDQFNTEAFQKLSSAEIYDAVIRKQIRFSNHSLSLFAAANNIFNELYITAAYADDAYPHPERSFRAGFNLEIN